ncbi:MAG: FAD/NAD(P)-binding oxidoreductase [Gammaproteobacteria bacterium]
MPEPPRLLQRPARSTRRRFLAGATALLGAAGGWPALALTRPQVVVVGGGAGGAAVVRQLVALGRDALDITLVEAERTYTTCYYSNLHLAGYRSLESLQFGFEGLAALPRVRVVHEQATAVEREARQVRLADGTKLPYECLVLAPGIALDYDSVPGWSEAAAQQMPHAWQAGSQTALLERQLRAVPDGGLIVVIAPPDPYRCPPGPYERVSMMAHALKSSGRNQAHIVIIDPKQSFSKQPLFQQGWEKYYPGMIEWMPPTIHAGLLGVEPATLTVETGFETYRHAALVNVVPRQTAARIAIDTGLSAADGYCPIDPYTMKSRADPAIFILGDAAQAGDMPKSAFAAHDQSRVVADTIAHDLLGIAAAEARYHNRCWSLVATDDSVVVGGRYEPTSDNIRQVDSDLSALDDAPERRRTNAAAAAAWYRNLTTALYR